jgi:hypothetical protein
MIDCPICGADRSLYTTGKCKTYQCIRCGRWIDEEFNRYTDNLTEDFKPIPEKPMSQLPTSPSPVTHLKPKEKVYEYKVFVLWVRHDKNKPDYGTDALNALFAGGWQAWQETPFNDKEHPTLVYTLRREKGVSSKKEG